MKTFRHRLAELILGDDIEPTPERFTPERVIRGDHNALEGEDMIRTTSVYLRVHKGMDGTACAVAPFNPSGSEKYQLFVAQPGESDTDLLARAYTLIVLGQGHGR